MRIKIGDTWLSGAPDDSWKSQASGLKVNGERIAQVSEAIRAAAAEVFDRGNLRNTVQFSVSRYHPTEAAAELFALDHPAAVPSSGTVTFHAVAAGGASVTRTMTATVKAIGVSVQGLTTKHDYTLIGGAISS